MSTAHLVWLTVISSSLLIICGEAFTLNHNKKDAGGCEFSLNGNIDDYLPLLLNPEATTIAYAFHQPDPSNGMVTLDENQIVILSCPGGEVELSGSSTRQAEVEASCSSGSSLLVNNKTVSVSSITCTRYPFHIARYSGATCLEKYKEIEIGFETESMGFLAIIHECFDDVTQNTLYSVFDLPKTIGGYQSGYPRPNFIEDDFYNVGQNSVENLYKRATEKKTINALVGLPANSEKYIHSSDDYFMSRGHMTAKADFVYGSNQRATFHYVNVVPQWQVFNGRSWNDLEQNVRHFAADKLYDLVVYTGVHGVSTLPHEETGEQIPLYLYVDGEERGIPVPRLMWKIVYDPVEKTGVAFVGVNNPYHPNVQEEVVCQDICDQVGWLEFAPGNEDKGYLYCCDVNELRGVVDTVPTDFDVVDLLN